MDVFSNAWHRAGVLLAVALIGLSLFHLGQMATAMATSSLSTDEFGTVGSFSSKGPWNVVTDYRAPKNHVFFNLLNSILPGRESLATGRVRALSILATILTALVLAAYAAWRSRWLEGAILLALWSSAPQTLALSMEARGYGFLGLFALIATVATVEYLRDRNPRWLWTLGISVTLGVYTVPGFLFFAGPLLLLLWLVVRSRATFFTGAITAAAILLLYAPLLAQVYTAFTGFHADKAEADFETAHGLVRAAKLYLFQTEDWIAWLLLFVLAAAPFVPVKSRRETTALRILSGACLIYFTALLTLRTPPLRMAAFCLLPLGLAGLWSIGGWLRDYSPRVVRIFIGGTAGVFLSCWLWIAIHSFQFVPTENWSLAARAIDTAFPSSMHVEFRRYAKYLRQTLPDAEKRSAEYDPATFTAGELIVADASNKWAEGSRFSPPANSPRAIRWVIPGSIRDIVLNLCPPTLSGLDVPPRDLTDGRTDTGVDLSTNHLVLRKGAGTDGAKALIVMLNREAAPGEVHVDDGTHPLPALFAGNALVLPLEPNKAAELHFHTNPPSNLQAVEAWITR